jgi:hypothetical protein
MLVFAQASSAASDREPNAQDTVAAIFLVENRQRVALFRGSPFTG